MQQIVPKKKKFLKLEEEVQLINFLAVQNSQIGLWHRPSESHIQFLKKHNVTHIITLQSEKEQPHCIGNECKKNQIEWIHIPLNGANEPLLQSKEVKTMLLNQFEIVSKLIQQQNKILIHCAAGIHRTGVFAYCILRLSGMDPAQSKDYILKLREDTYKGVGDHRIKIAEDLIQIHLNTN